MPGRFPKVLCERKEFDSDSYLRTIIGVYCYFDSASIVSLLIYLECISGFSNGTNEAYDVLVSR